MQSPFGNQAAQPRGGAGGGGGGRGGSAKLTHALLWGAVLAVYLCIGTLTSLELKLLLSVLVPVGLFTTDKYQECALCWNTAARSALIASGSPAPPTSATTDSGLPLSLQIRL